MNLKSMLMGVLVLVCACALGGETSENVVAQKAGTFVAQETATEKTRKAIAKLFPGWSLDTKVFDHDSAGVPTCHRGRNNVIFVHSENKDTPAIISRTVTLPDKNPCLYLMMASWNEVSDFLLSVRVNGKMALPNRRICTPISEPWQNLVIPLFDWRGETVKVEIVIAGWRRESPCLARIEIAEGSGAERIIEGKETVNSYEWSYRIQNGEAMIVAEYAGDFAEYAGDFICPVSPCPIGEIAIPATLGGAKVTRLGRDAFIGCTALTSVIIPEGVVRIERAAFQECTGLRSVSLPSSVKVLEPWTLHECSALTSLILPKGLEIIGLGAFAGCSALPAVVIPPNVRQIGQGAFWGCSALTSITIPASVTNIHKTAFGDTGALRSFCVDENNRFYKSENGLLLTKDGATLVHGVNGTVTIPSSVTVIGSSAFDGCASLRSIVIPSGVKSIGDSAFAQCRGMTSVVIPEGVTRIGRDTFESCLELRSMKIPNGVTRIGMNAFRACLSLESVQIPSSVQRIESGAFHGCSSLISLTIPSKIAKIDPTAFEGCSKLKSVQVLKDGKTEIVPFDEFCKQLKQGQTKRAASK